MEFWTTLRNAELKLLGMSGKGLGAVLLAVILIFALWSSGSGKLLVSILDAMPDASQRSE